MSSAVLVSLAVFLATGVVYWTILVRAGRSASDKANPKQIKRRFTLLTGGIAALFALAVSCVVHVAAVQYGTLQAIACAAALAFVLCLPVWIVARWAIR